MKRSVFILTALCGVLVALAGWLPSAPAAAQTAQRCFPETGQCIAGRIREYWEQNGGLPVFGYPIAAQEQATVEGKTLQIQWFERNRLELHPENARPYDVLLGRLGVDRLAQQGRDWQGFPKSAAQAGCRFFAETGQNVCGAILAAWRANGLEFDGVRGKSEGENLALFGLPVGPLQAETLSDGKQYQVQWFERARFELHPENAAPYTVLLGLLGNELRSGGAGSAPTPAPAQPTATPGPTPSPTPDAGAAGVPQQIDLFPPDPQQRAECSDRAPGTFEVRKLTAGTQNTDLSNNFLIKAPIDFPLCLTGFRANERVKIDVTRPDGSTRSLQVRVDGDGEEVWYFPIGPNDNLGLFKVTATGGNGATATGSVQVVETGDGDERLVPIPRATNGGEDIRVYLAGFEPDRSVKLHIYRVNTKERGDYVGSLSSLRTNGQGEADVRINTDSYTTGQYVIGRFVNDDFEPFQTFQITN